MINQRLGTRFVLTEEPCCAALQVTDGNSKTLQATANSSTQHGRNTDFPASFALEWDTDTIGLVVLVAALLALFVAAAALPDAVGLVEEVIAVAQRLLCVLVYRDGDRLDVLIAVALTGRPLAQLGKRVDPG